MQEVSIYRGIEYVRVSQLPEDERQQIRNWLNTDMLIKIQTEKELLPDCVVYKNYVRWFENIYTKISPADLTAKSQAAEASAKAKPIRGLAFD